MHDSICARKAAAPEVLFVNRSNAPCDVSLIETSQVSGLGMARKVPGNVTGRRLFIVLLLIGVVPLLPGCATQKPKPWEHKRPGWWETNIDTDDRAFYHDFFMGR
jgi:hypothetical protein